MLRRETRTALLQRFPPVPAFQTSAAMWERTLTVSLLIHGDAAAVCNVHIARQWVKSFTPCADVDLSSNATATPRSFDGRTSMESVDSRTSTPSPYNRRSMDASALRADMRGLLFGSKASTGEPRSQFLIFDTSLWTDLRPDGTSQEAGLSFSVRRAFRVQSASDAKKAIDGGTEHSIAASMSSAVVDRWKTQMNASCTATH